MLSRQEPPRPAAEASGGPRQPGQGPARAGARWGPGRRAPPPPPTGPPGRPRAGVLLLGVSRLAQGHCRGRRGARPGPQARAWLRVCQAEPAMCTRVCSVSGTLFRRLRCPLQGLGRLSTEGPGLAPQSASLTRTPARGAAWRAGAAGAPPGSRAGGGGRGHEGLVSHAAQGSGATRGTPWGSSGGPHFRPGAEAGQREGRWVVAAPTSILTCKAQSQESQVGGDGLARQARDKDREDPRAEQPWGSNLLVRAA